MDLNPPVPACESCAKPCATGYVLIGGIGGNWVSQMDFSAYLSHFQLLIKITGTIRSSERLSRHHKNFICVLHTLNLNYYHIQLHYKLAIHFVQEY